MEMMLSLSILAIFVLLVLSAFFSGSETALTAASRPRLHALGRDGNTRALIVERLRDDKDRLIGGILLGNNLVNIMATALASNVLILLFGEAGIVYATLVMTALVLIFSEVLPKTYAMHNPEQLALAVGPAMRVIIGLFSPVTFGIQKVVAATFSLFGVTHVDHMTVSDDEAELRGAIDLHGTDSAQEVKHERAMLRSILDLDDVEVGDIMTHRRHAVSIDVSQSPQDIVQQVLASPHTRIPLWREDPDNIVGVLHAKDLLRAVQAAGQDTDKVDVMTIASEPWFIPDSANLLDQLQAFRDRREHFALVVDEYGTFLGIVTLEDILEEIVGEIHDEHDVRVSGVVPQDDGSVLVRGTVTIRDLNREFDWNLPDEDAATIAGLVLHEARMIPDIGQVFAFHGFRFEIMRRQRNQITSLRVTRLSEDDNS